MNTEIRFKVYLKISIKLPTISKFNNFLKIYKFWHLSLGW